MKKELVGNEEIILDSLIETMKKAVNFPISNACLNELTFVRKKGDSQLYVSKKHVDTSVITAWILSYSNFCPICEDFSYTELSFIIYDYLAFVDIMTDHYYSFLVNALCAKLEASGFKLD